MKEATKIWILGQNKFQKIFFKILVFSGLRSSGFWQMPGLALSFLLTSMRSLDKSGRRLNFTLSNKSALRPLLTYDQTDEKSWMLSIGNNCLVAQFWTLLVGNAGGGQTMKTCFKDKDWMKMWWRHKQEFKSNNWDGAWLKIKQPSLLFQSIL